MGFISFVPHVEISNIKSSKTTNICPRAMVLVAEAADPGLNKLLDMPELKIIKFPLAFAGVVDE